MRAPVVVISVIAHAVLFGALSRIVVRPHGGGPRSVPAAADGAPAPIEVVMLDAPPAPVAASAPVAAGSTAWPQQVARGSTHAAGAIGTSTGSEGLRTSTGTEPLGTGSGVGPGETAAPGGETRAPNLGLDPAVAERIASAPHARGEEPRVTGKLENTPGGGAVVHDAVTTLTVSPDGTAHFKDKRDIDLHVKLPIPHLDVEGMREDLGRELTEWFRDPSAGTRFGRTADLSNVILAVPGACNSWGDTWCDDPSAPGAEKYVREQKRTDGSLLGGAADISAYLQRKLVGDPYASRKLKLLDDTRDERVARGTVFRREQLARSAELMHRTLEGLWRATRDPAQRREVLFELWDDCAEGDGPAGEAGQRARAVVVGWIRAHLPAGSPDAFSDEEIARLGAQRASKQPFTPY